MGRLRIGWIAAGMVGGVLLAAAALGLTEQRRAMAAAAAQIDALGSQVIETPCGPIEYAVAGTGSPVLVVHGNGGGFDQGLGWRPATWATAFR